MLVGSIQILKLRDPNTRSFKIIKNIMLTKKQNKEIKCLRYFVQNCDYGKIKNDSLLHSCKLIIHKDNGKSAETSYFYITNSGVKVVYLKNKKEKNKLLKYLDAKKWRLRQIDLWEQSVLDGSIPYFVLLGGEDYKEILPEYVISFMCNTMFKGYDKYQIKRVHNYIIQYWTWYRKIIFIFSKILFNIKYYIKYYIKYIFNYD
jgi:hypothetical protein